MSLNRTNMKAWGALALIVTLLTGGCTNLASSPAAESPATEVVIVITNTPEPPTVTPVPPTPTATLPPTETPIPSPSPEPTVTFTPSPAPTPMGLNQTENILVLGTDTRPGPWFSRTDTIMVVAIDHNAGQVGIISIPRDLYVDIPGYGKDRINAADFVGEYELKYEGGGAALAQRVVEENLGIPTQKYVRIKQQGLPRLVDALGGVTVTLECPLYERTPSETSASGYEDFSLPSGEVFLDGAAAKKFVTYRYLSSDFSRARRQQQLIWALRDLGLQMDIVPRIPELWAALKDTFATDLNLLDVIKLARLGISLESQNVHSLVLDQTVVENWTTPGGGAVLRIKDPQVLQQKLAGLFNSKPLSEVGKDIPGGCPPAPPGMKAWPTPTPRATATPEITATLEVTATLEMTVTPEAQ